MGTLFTADDRQKIWVVKDGRLGTAHIGADGLIKDFRAAEIQRPASMEERKARAFPPKGVRVRDARIDFTRGSGPVEYVLEGNNIFAAVPVEYRYNGQRCGDDTVRVINPLCPRVVGEEAFPAWVLAHAAEHSEAFAREHAKWQAARQKAVDEFPDRLREAAVGWAENRRVRAAIANWIGAPVSAPRGRVFTALSSVKGYHEFMSGGTLAANWAAIAQILESM